MNKAELVNFISKSHNTTKSETEAWLTKIFESIMNALQKGEKVNLMGFGAWNVVKREARDGHHPKTGEKIKIKEHYLPVFKAGKALKEVCNKKSK